MRKARELIGLSVVNVNTGNKIGTVRDLLFDPEGGFRGVVLEPRGILRRRQYIPSEQILSVGEDALTVDSDQVIAFLDAEHSFHTLLYGEQKMKGKPVLTTSGQELGQVEDVYFHEEMGTLIGYELTDGFLSDVMEGRKVLPKPVFFTFGEDAIVVPQGSRRQLEEGE